MKEDKTVPQLRFPEFTDAWKQRELNEIADTIDTGKSIFSKSNIGKFKILGSTGVIGFDEDYDYEGSFLLTARVGANAGNLYRSSGKVKITDNTVFIKSKFIDYLFYSLEKFNLKRLSFGTGQPLIKSSELKKLNISVPCDENEITKIEHFFITIDRTITLQQRKLNSLQKLKKGLLQKMFPKKGENIPEIRFPKFSDAWKQRKLREVVKEFYNGQTPYRQNKAYWGGNVNWLTSGDLNRDVVTNTIEKITEEGQKASRLRIIPKETLVIAIMGLEAAGTRGNCGILGIDTTINQACMALIANESIATKDFLFQWYKAFGNRLALKFTQGTKQQNYNEELLGNLDISYPSLKEQQQIGAFFTQLDNTITLQQRKLESLQKLKKGLLQQMFI